MEYTIPQMFLKSTVDTTKDDKLETPDFMAFFTSDSASKVDMPTSSNTEKKKTTRRKKDNDPTIASVPVNQAVATNAPYIDSYNETNTMLRAAIIQVDGLSASVAEDINTIRNSKTLKSKYTYLTNLTGSASALVGTKIQAIKEINSSITQAHNLELKRLSQNKASAEAEKNDDMRIMQLYDAFINAPVGVYDPNSYMNTPMQALSTAIPDNNPNLARVNIDNADEGYTAYMQNLTPEQNRMMMDTNPNIKAVVKYNPDDGSRWFDVIDVTTGQSVPNVARPGDFLMQDTIIDVHNQIARNRNVDKTWPLVLVGSGKIMEY